MANLFVSYARENGSVAHSLVNDLSEFGHDAFFDRDIRGGQQWWDVLLDRIAAADGFLPVLSEDYRLSDPCRREAQWAQAVGVPILPIDLGEVSPQLFPLVIQRANWVRYDATSREALSRLLRAVQDLPPVVRPDPLPPRPDVPTEYLSVEAEISGSIDIPRARQLEILSDLRGRLDSRDPQAVRVLLRDLRRRPEVTVEVAAQIDTLLAQHTQRSASPPPFASGPGPGGSRPGGFGPPGSGPAGFGSSSSGSAGFGSPSSGSAAFRPPSGPPGQPARPPSGQPSGPPPGGSLPPGWEGRLGTEGARLRARYKHAKVPAIVLLCIGGFFALAAIGSVGDKSSTAAAGAVMAVIGVAALAAGFAFLVRMLTARSGARNAAIARYSAQFMEPSTVPLSAVPMFDGWLRNVERMRPYH